MKYWSDCTARVANSEGGTAPTSAFDIVTPSASAPAPMATVPGSATVGVVDPDPDAERCSPNACAVTPLTPLHAESSTPASVAGCAKMAWTQSAVVGLVLGSG